MKLRIRKIPGGRFKIIIDGVNEIYKDSIQPLENLPDRVIREIAERCLQGEDLSIEWEINWADQ